MTRPFFVHLGDGEYIGTHGMSVSFADPFGNEATLTLRDGTKIHGNWRQCRAEADRHAQEATA